MNSNDSSNFLLAEAQLILDQSRKVKSERTKTLGDPIQLPGKAIAVEVRDGFVWIGENTTVVKKIDLNSGKTMQIFRGHSGPVTSVAFCDKVHGSGDGKLLITGSWDMTIKVWDTDTKEVISSTDAHEDFVKSLLVLPSLQLLVSGSSDKTVRFWDLSTPTQANALRNMGLISAHARPVECLDGKATSESTATLFTGDTMGIIRVWDLVKEAGPLPRWRSTIKEELNHHRTRINEIMYGSGQLWTASADETVQVVPDKGYLSSATKMPPPITHPLAVRAILPLLLTDLAEPYLLTGAGDVIRIYDVSSDEPELIGEVDAHWHDVTAIRLWIRKTVGKDGKTRVEPWIISASLDGTIRRWRLSELLDPTTIRAMVEVKSASVSAAPAATEVGMAEITEEEERELAELLDSD